MTNYYYLILTPRSVSTSASNPDDIEYNRAQTRILNTLIDSLDTGFILSRFDLSELPDRKGSHEVVLLADIEDIVSIGYKLHPFVDKMNLVEINPTCSDGRE
jgi:hypothetical protein